MRLEFLGACREVGRSAFIIEENGYRLQLDSGVKVHDHFEPHPEPSKPVDAVVTSHAHLDHSGALPLRFKHRPLPSFVIFPTIPLIELLVEDSLKIAKQEGKTLPISKKEVKAMEKGFTPLPFNKQVVLENKASFELFDAGHILGSAQVFYKGGKSVFYTGDFRLSPTRLHKGAVLPKERVDALIVESSYAAREQPLRDEVEERFAQEVRKAVDGGLTVLVPCFAVGRTQEILMVLAALGFQGRVSLDGMGKQVNHIYTDFPSYLRDSGALNKALQRTRMIEDAADRKAALREPGVIIAGSGMLEGGRAMSYLRELNKAGNGIVMLTGFQVQGSNGDRLLREAWVKDGNEKVRVRLPVQLHNFSAHATRSDLFEAVKRLNPEKVFCVHGEPDGCTGFANELREQGFDAAAPRAGENVKL